MNILVTNVYSYQNKGDAAIVLALLKELSRVFEKPELLIQTADAANDEGRYGPAVSHSLLWLLLSAVRDRPLPARLWVVARGVGGLTLFLAGRKYLGQSWRFLLTRDLRRFVAECDAADLVVACGGGYIRTQSASLQNTLLLAVTCLNFLAAKYMGKPVFLYSQSIGPVHGRVQRAIVRFALNRVDLVESREDVSTKFLKGLHLRSQVVTSADSALLLGGSGVPLAAYQTQPGHLRVGLTVRKWFNTQEELEFYMRAMAKTIDYLVEAHNAEVFYIPQVIAKKFGDDDREVALQVRGYVRHKNRFTVIDQDLHPFEIIGLCGSMGIFIGTRMHSNIFALISHVPVVAIEYEHKTRGIMRGLGLEHLTIDISKATFETIKQKVEEVIANRGHYRDIIRRNLPAQVKQGQRAIEMIKEAYDSQAQNA